MSVYETADERADIMKMKPANGFEWYDPTDPTDCWSKAYVPKWDWSEFDYRPAADDGWEIVGYRQATKCENYIGASGRTEMWLGAFTAVSANKYWIVRKVEPEKSTEIVECEVTPDINNTPIFPRAVSGTHCEVIVAPLAHAASLPRFRGYKVEKVREREKISRTDGTLLDAGVALTDDGRCTDSLEWIAATGHRVTHVCLEVEK